MIQSISAKTRVFLEMIKFEHSIFALPFAYLGLFLGGRGWPGWKIFFLVTAAMVSFRTMAMGLNRLIDLQIDGLNPRTAKRALPAGLLNKPFVWAATAVSFLLFEAAAYALGPRCFSLTPVPVALAVLYPFMKRFTWFSHMVLGIILAIAPYGSWLASGGGFSWTPGFMMIGVAAWVSGFDLIYALQDLDFDRQHGLHSFPAAFGYDAALFTARILHAVTIFAWIASGRLAGLGPVYFGGLILITAFLIREHWLIRSAGLKKIEEAFFTMNACVSVSLFAIVLIDLVSRGGLS